ncbi:MAG: hypothetical protein K8S23_07965 [Candidatus Cloacimonetes bacterium]|nr:hypothetical protein [Candidatus Cloacimonadota bacterium]
MKNYSIFIIEIIIPYIIFTEVSHIENTLTYLEQINYNSFENVDLTTLNFSSI